MAPINASILLLINWDSYVFILLGIGNLNFASVNQEVFLKMCPKFYSFQSCFESPDSDTIKLIHPKVSKVTIDIFIFLAILDLYFWDFGKYVFMVSLVTGKQ